MRFASTQGVGGYSSAGKAVTNASSDIFKTARRHGPDYSGLGQAAIKHRGNEKVAAINAEATVAKAGLNATASVKKQQIEGDARVKATQIKVDADSYVADKKRKGQMAGKLAAVGASAAGLLGGSSKRPRNTKGGLDLKDEIAAQQGVVDSHNAKAESYLTADATKKSSSSAANINTSGSLQIDQGNTAMRQMQSLVNDGYSTVSAAAIVGNTRHESGNYKHHEEIAPNAYGTRGAGWFQWTDTGTSGGRRTNFENYAASQGVKPNSYEANSGFMIQEMRTGGQWGRGSRDEFMGIQDVGQASDYFSNTYLRPAARTANLSGRRTYAQEALTEWNQLQTQPRQTLSSPPAKSTTIPFEHKPIEYLTGDRDHGGFRPDHGGSNYHEHVAYATTAQRNAAIKRAQNHGFVIGSIDTGKHAPTSYHYSNQAFDVPGSQFAVGKEAEGSRRFRQIMGID